MGLCLCADIVDTESEMAYTHKLNSNMTIIRNRIRAKKLPVIWMDGGELTGKLNHGYNITERFGFAHIMADKLLMEESKKDTDAGKIIRSKINANKPVPNKLMMNLLKSAFVKAGDCNGFLINSFPQNPKQASMFVREIAPVDCIILLEEESPQKDQRTGEGDSNEGTAKDTFINQYDNLVEKISVDDPPADVFLKIEAAILDRLSTHPS